MAESIIVPISYSTLLKYDDKDSTFSNLNNLRLRVKGTPSSVQGFDYALVKLDTAPVNGKRIVDTGTVTFKLGLTAYGGEAGGVGTPSKTHIRAVMSEWDPNTVTYNNKPEMSGTATASPAPSFPANYPSNVRASLRFSEVQNLLQYGAYIYSAPNLDEATANYNFYLMYMGYKGWGDIQSQLILQVEIPTPVIADTIPQSGANVSKNQAVTFSWGLTAENVFGTIAQKTFKFRWRVKGQTNYTEKTIISAEKKYTAPAGTFTANQIEWQVQAQSSDDVWSNNTAWNLLNTADSLSNAVPVSPINTYLDKSVANSFTWQHIISTGTPSSKSELQYSFDLATWTALATVTGPSLSVQVAANALPSGRLFWRVRTYNSDGAAGSWSEAAAVVVKGAPDAPLITSIGNTARPVIRWQSREQQSFQLQILDAAGSARVDTGEQYGTGKAYAPTGYLEDGGYTARVRIRNSSGMWSAWAALGFTISTAKPKPPEAFCYAGDGFVSITVENAGDYSKLYLLRDGVPVARISGKYLDYAALGECVYTVRGIDGRDRFVDSEPMLAHCHISAGVELAPVDNPGQPLRLLLRRGEPRRQSGSLELPGTLTHFAGRQYPVYETSEFIDEAYSLPLSLRNQEQWKRLRQLVLQRKTVLFRDAWDNKYYGVITAVSHDQDHLSTDFTLSVSCVDYIEQIQYDPPEVN